MANFKIYVLFPDRNLTPTLSFRKEREPDKPEGLEPRATGVVVRAEGLRAPDNRPGPSWPSPCSKGDSEPKRAGGSLRAKCGTMGTEILLPSPTCERMRRCPP